MINSIHNVVSTVNATPYDLLTPERQVDHAKLIAHNKTVILQALIQAEVETAEASYEGQGDSGSFVEVIFHPSLPKELSEQVKIIKHFQTFDQVTRIWITTLEESNTHLNQAIELFTYDLITASGHGGYENNNGGYGDITFDTATKEITHDHYDYIIEQAHSVCKY